MSLFSGRGTGECSTATAHPVTSAMRIMRDFLPAGDSRIASFKYSYAGVRFFRRDRCARLRDRTGQGRRSTLKVADMPAISYSNPPIIGPVLARSGMVRSRARITLWPGQEGQKPRECGWFSNHRDACRPVTWANPIRALSSSSACLRGRPPGSLLKLKGSARVATASRNREAVS